MKFEVAFIAVWFALLPMASAEEWTKSWNVGAQPELRVEAGDGSITIEKGRTGVIEAKLVTEGYKIGYDGIQVIEHQTGDHVDIRLKEPSGHFSWHSHSIRLHIQAPEQLNAIAKTGDGSIILRGVRGSLRVETGDGSIQGSELGGGLDAHTGDGSMRISGTFDDLRLRTGDGSIQLDALPGSQMHSNWELHSGDGSISMKLPKNLAAELLMRTGDGHIHSDLPLTVNDIRSQHEVRGKLNGGGMLLSIHTGDGSISVGSI